MATTTKPLAASRLPRTRESRPLILGLAILLIVGGALGSAYLAIQSGHRAYFVSVGRDVPQGAAITKDDLTRVSLPEDYQDGISTDDTGSVVGKTATTHLLVGTVLIPKMLSTRRGGKANQVTLAFAVDKSLVPSGVQPGAQLALTLVDDQNDTQPDAILADLVAIDRGKSGGGLAGSSDDDVTLTVAVDKSCVTQVSAAGRNKNVVPAQLGSSRSSLSETCSK